MSEKFSYMTLATGQSYQVPGKWNLNFFRNLHTYVYTTSPSFLGLKNNVIVIFKTESVWCGEQMQNLLKFTLIHALNQTVSSSICDDLTDMNFQNL